MPYEIERLAQTLKAAREAKGLSQRALSQASGVPQSHISNIERGTVDLRVSSLIQLARHLGLELGLVPRKALPAVDSIVRRTARGMSPTGSTQGPPTEAARPAYSLDEDDGG